MKTLTSSIAFILIASSAFAMDCEKSKSCDMAAKSDCHASAAAKSCDAKNTADAASDKVCSQMVAAYEAIASKLVADDFEGAKMAADHLASAAEKMEGSPIGENAQAIAGSENIFEARKAFSKLSQAVIAAAESTPGYYVVQCPMFENGIWLQSTEKVSNPYMGQSMPGCGMIKKKTAGNSEGDVATAGSMGHMGHAH